MTTEQKQKWLEENEKAFWLSTHNMILATDDAGKQRERIRQCELSLETEAIWATDPT